MRECLGFSRIERKISATDPLLRELIGITSGPVYASVAISPLLIKCKSVVPLSAILGATWAMNGRFYLCEEEEEEGPSTRNGKMAGLRSDG